MRRLPKLLLAASLTLTLAATAIGLRAQTLQNVEPGPRLIDGSLINSILARVNGGTTNATFSTLIAAPAATDQAFFVATRAYLVIGIREVHAVAAGGTSTIQVTKDTGTTAPGAGTDLLTTAFNLNGTANTVQTGALVTSTASLTLAAGDRLSVDFADAIQSSVGVVITVALQPL